MEMPTSTPEENPSAQFPRWMDKECLHPCERQIRDGMGTICGDCGAIRVMWQ